MGIENYYYPYGIYYTFKDFEDNYNKDLKKWLSIYTDGTERYYLLFERSKYKYIFSFFGTKKNKFVSFDFPETFLVRKGDSYEEISGEYYSSLLTDNMLGYISEYEEQFGRFYSNKGEKKIRPYPKTFNQYLFTSY